LVTANTNDYFGQKQLQEVADLSVMGQGRVPAPVDVAPADIATDGPRAHALEGVLTRVQNLRVTAVEPEAGPGDGRDGAPTFEFVVNDGLRINDYLHRAEPFPGVGDAYDAIIGVVRFGNGNSKLEPRDADELMR
jgi:hypothetical protein